MGSAMAEHFKPYAWLCRAVGVFFIRNLQAADSDAMHVTWKTGYTLYSLVCLLSFNFIQLAMSTTKILRVFIKSRAFTKSVYLVLPTVVTVRVVTNQATALFGSWTMLEFFKMSAKYEKKALFDLENYRYKSYLPYVLRTCMLAALLAYIAIVAGITAQSVDTAGNPLFEFVVRASVLLVSLPFLTYDMMHSVVLKPCCEMLTAYVRHQRDALMSALAPGSDLSTTSGATEVEKVRMNLMSIGNLRKLLNKTWQFSVMAAAIVVLCEACVCICCAFDEGVPTDQLLVNAAYAIYATFDFLDMAWLSQAMVNEVRDLKETLAKASVFGRTPALFREVTYLHNSLIYEEMFLSGGNFFSLNMPLLVSLAGSVITYSVILVQTSDSVENFAATRFNYSAFS